MRAVAAHLGVSVAALYYHVSGREELLLLAAEQSIDRIPLPADRDQHWAVWLYEWAEYARRAFGSDPTLLSRFIDGGIGVDRMVDHIETALALCVRNGFTEQEALDAYNLVSGLALGFAIRDIRLAAMASLVSFAVGYNPRLFQNLLTRVDSLTSGAGRSGARPPAAGR